MRKRCQWAVGDPLIIEYHDREWGVPTHDDRRLFEFLILEGAQAGLSWLTILQKRENLRRSFAGFDPEKVARFGRAEIKRLLREPGIIRNELKIRAAITNAQAFLRIQREFESFDQFIWKFVGGAPIRNRWRTARSIPATSAEAQLMSRELKGRGFAFVGPTICYAFMQAVGMVNDHTIDCFRYG